MTQLTIEDVKQKFALWRQTRKRTQKIPDYLIEDVKELSKSFSLTKLFKEFNINWGGRVHNKLKRFRKKYINSLKMKNLNTSHSRTILLSKNHPHKIKKEIEIPKDTTTTPYKDLGIMYNKKSVRKSIIKKSKKSNKILNVEEFKKYIKNFDNVTLEDNVFHIHKNKDIINEDKIENSYIQNNKCKLQKIDNYIFISKLLFCLIIYLLFFLKLSYYEMLCIFSITYNLFSIIEYFILSSFIHDDVK